VQLDYIETTVFSGVSYLFTGCPGEDADNGDEGRQFRYNTSGVMR